MSVSINNVAIIGATGAVGKEMINCLYRLKYPMTELHLFASEKSKGIAIVLPDSQSKVVEEFSINAVVNITKCGMVLMAVSVNFAEQYAPRLVDAGCMVIDNSSAFRYHDHVPLIVPGLNGDILDKEKGPMIISNPNCTTAIMAMVIHPLAQKFGRIKRIIASTYQAASGAGEAGMSELEDAIIAYANKDENFFPEIFSHNLCANVIPCIDSVTENDYTKEEMKMVWETRKIFSDPNIAISCTAVRVPTMRAHCISATIEFDHSISPADVRDCLKGTPGVTVTDDPRNKEYPVPSIASNRDEVFVGRIRRNLAFDKKNNGIDLFICGDQLLRGAALNAVEIALRLVGGGQALCQAAGREMAE